MIIIKIIFIYFVEIAQTDDSPSTGTRLEIITLHTILRSKTSFNSVCRQQCNTNQLINAAIRLIVR